MYNNILIPTDGSATALKGLEHGLKLAKVSGAKATVITITQPYPLQIAMTEDSWTASKKAKVDEIETNVRALARKSGLEIDFLWAVNEAPAAAIVSASKDNAVDLIVMSSHGRRGLGRVLLGSQAAEVVAYSSVPVMIIR